MSLPSVSEINSAASVLASVADNSNNPAGAQQEARQVCERYRGAFARAVAAAEAIVFADATRADLAALFAAEASGVAVDEFFTVADADDTTDNALQAAKGSAVAADDMFQRTAAAAVKYIGQSDEDFATMDASLAD
jgi:hypothetical protein